MNNFVLLYSLLCSTVSLQIILHNHIKRLGAGLKSGVHRHRKGKEAKAG